MAHHKTAGDDAFELRKSNLGVRMTILYAVIYGGFVALNVFQPTLMGTRVLFGLNLAVAYGVALIIIAIIFAVAYNLLLGVKPSTAEKHSSSGTEQGNTQRRNK